MPICFAKFLVPCHLLCELFQVYVNFYLIRPLINTELLPCHTQPVNCVSQFGTWVNFRFNKSQMAVCCNFGYLHIVFGYFHRSSHTEFCNLFHLLLFQHMSIFKVVEILECPINFCTTLGSIPTSKHLVAKVCLIVWG